MKKIFKKVIIPLLLVFCMCLSTGCKKNNEDANSDVSDITSIDSAVGSDDASTTDDANEDVSSDENTSSKDTQGTDSTASTSKKPSSTKKRQPDKDTAELKAMKDKVDFKGKEIVIMYEWSPVTEQGYGSSTHTDNEIDRIKELEEKYNVKLTLKKCATSPYGAAIITSIMSGKPNANIYFAGKGFVLPAVQANLLANFNDAMDKTGITLDASYYNELSTAIGNINGKQYQVGAGVRLGGFIAYNRTIIESLGLEDPHTLIEKKQWNWDAVTKIAKAATLRDKDGQITRYGLGFSLYHENVVGMALANNASMVTIDKNGKMVNNINSKEFRETLEQVAKWCTVDKVAAVNYGQVDWRAFDEDFFVGKFAMLFGQFNTLQSVSGKMKDDYGIAYLPMGPSAKEYVSYAYDDYGYVVPINYQSNTLEYLMLLDDLCKPMSKDDFRGEWISCFADSKSYKYFKNMVKGGITQKTDFMTQGEFDIPITGLHDGNITAAQVIGKANNTVTAKIKDSYSNINYYNLAEILN